MSFADPNHFKDEFGVAGEQVFAYVRAAFALQGHQYALRALPASRNRPEISSIALAITP